MFTLSICTHTPARASLSMISLNKTILRKTSLIVYSLLHMWLEPVSRKTVPWWDFGYFLYVTEYFHNPKFQNQAFRGFWEWEGRKGHFHFLKGSDSYMSSSAYIERGWKKFRNIYCRYFRPLPLIKHKQKVHMNSNKDKIWVTFRFSVKVKNPKDLPHRACMAFSSLSEIAIWTNFYRPNIPQISRNQFGHSKVFFLTFRKKCLLSKIL